MNINEYKNRISTMLRKSDIAAAGSMANLAAACVLYCSEQGHCMDEVDRLEECAGIFTGEEGESE